MATAADLLNTPAVITIEPIATGFDRDALFEQVCKLYPDSKIEMDAEGNIVVAPGNSPESAYRSGEAFRQVANWA